MKLHQPFCSGLNMLTHLGRETYICVTKPDRPSHYVNQCRNNVNWTLRNKLQWNLNRNSYIFIQENALKISSGKWRPFYFGLSLYNIYCWLWWTLAVRAQSDNWTARGWIFCQGYKHILYILWILQLHVASGMRQITRVDSCDILFSNCRTTNIKDVYILQVASG